MKFTFEFSKNVFKNSTSCFWDPSISKQFLSICTKFTQGNFQVKLSSKIERIISFCIKKTVVPMITQIGCQISLSRFHSKIKRLYKTPSPTASYVTFKDSEEKKQLQNK